MFDRITTTQCVPSEDYIQKCVESEPVLRYIEKSRYPAPIYVITGVKVVSGATVKSGKYRGISGGLGFKFNGTAHKSDLVPIGGGAETEVNRERRDLMSWEGSSDFVFAFRAVKVMVKKHTNKAIATDYTKGAMMGTDQVIKKDSAKMDIIVIEEVDAEEAGWASQELQEGDETIRCAVPRTDSLLEQCW